MGFKIKVAIGIGLLFLATLIVIIPAILLSPRTAKFREIFIRKCQAFPESLQRCEQILSTFEEAYVGREPCNFPEEAYRPLFEENPFTHSCDNTMFWSDTKDLAQGFCKKRNNFVCLQNTLLGNIMDGLTWCGKWSSKGKNVYRGPQYDSAAGRELTDTFFYLCEKCDINTVSSFWNKASAVFAKYACENTVVLLNGAISKPFDPNSTFGDVQVGNLVFPRVKSLTVILVIENNNADCNHESLKVLRNLMNPKIIFHCRTVTRAKILECIEKGTTTDACWT